MNKEEIIKRALYILHTTGYTNQLDKSICIDAIENLLQENKQIKDNWNKLKEALKSQSDFKLKCDYKNLYFEVDELLEEMEKLEGGEK